MTDKYLVVKASGGGGLGDSIKSVLVAALYASLSDRILVVDWLGSLYSDGQINPFNNLFEIKNIRSQEQLPNSDDVFPVAWQGRLGKSLDEVYVEDGWEVWDRGRTIECYSFDLGKLDYSSEVLLMWEFDQVTKLSDLIDAPISNTLEAYRYAADRFIRFSPEFMQRLALYDKEFKKPVVGVHIRATNEFTENKGSLAVKHYLTAIDKLIKPGQSLFLATDNADVQSLIKQHYQNVITTTKWLAEPGQPLHKNNDCPDDLQNMTDALLDIVMLSKCNKLVLTPNSSFSEAAQIFAGPTVEILHPAQVQPFKRKFVYSLKRLIKIS